MNTWGDDSDESDGGGGNVLASTGTYELDEFGAASDEGGANEFSETERTSPLHGESESASQGGSDRRSQDESDGLRPRDTRGHSCLPGSLVQAFSRVVIVLERMATQQSDVQLKQTHLKVSMTLDHLLTRGKHDVHQPMFMFRDGPFTTAAKRGRPILLVGWDQPSQATTERFNSAVEPDRRFFLPEDSTNESLHGDSHDGSADGVVLPADFAVITTAHLPASSQVGTLRISLATLSRFSVVRTPE